MVKGCVTMRDIARTLRRGMGVALAGTLAVAALVVPAAPASADATITANEQTFYGYYRLDVGLHGRRRDDCAR